MYAEAFTKNFELIAERKSVVYHLRELAKASVIAKFLLDSDTEIEDSWFGLAEGTPTWEGTKLVSPKLTRV